MILFTFKKLGQSFLLGSRPFGGKSGVSIPGGEKTAHRG
ncbi:hypothetical protein LACWKB8_0306 [Lactobacillus sp. wkB8]|nr:hypothetical protein LACWKB8_0306 [Lactobacillus sp. wkB8]